jgi:hypothetical protein
MLLLILVAAVVWLNPAVEQPLLLGGVLALGSVGAILALLRKPWLTRFLGWVVLEELFTVACVGGPYPDSPFSWHGAVFVMACVLAGWLLLRMPLPEGLFPVRGRWLRALLAGMALLGLLQGGAWWSTWESMWAAPSLRPLLVFCLPIGLLGLALAGRLLVSGMARLPRGWRLAASAPGEKAPS